MKINREDFLSVLDLVSPGLTARDVIEQSSCFIFKEKKIWAFNEEIACSHESPIDITGAVRAKPLVEILRKLTEEEVDVDVDKEHFIIHGKRKKSGIRMEAEILLPIDSVETPKKWKKLDEHFCEGVGMVQSCASDDASQFISTCIHIHPECLEACDNYQLIRYKVKTGINQPVLARRDSLKHIVALEMIKFSETDKWLHFKNSSGLVFSCLRATEDYPSIDKYLDVKGSSIALPKGIGEAMDKAQVFSAENTEKNRVMVELRPGKCRLRGEGASGFYSEVKRLAYKGPSMKFYIDPKLLADIAQKYSSCEVNQKNLKATGERFTFVTSLGQEDEQEEKDGETDE